MPDPHWQRILKVDDLGKTVRVQVGYYTKEDEHLIRESLLSRSAHLPAHNAVMEIPAVEFLTYWLFEDKNPEDELYSSFEAISQQVEKSLSWLTPYFEHLKGNVRARVKHAGTEWPTDPSTRLGVSVGLAVTNHLLGRTRADWMKLPKTYVDGREQPRLDYDLTTTDDGYVAVENKGSIVPNNRRKSRVWERKREIQQKKMAVRMERNDRVLLGTITAADNRDDSTLKCWLLDPPIKLPVEQDPDLFRIVARLRYQAQLLHCIFPFWGSLHRAIADLVKSLMKFNNWRGYSGTPLRSVMGNPVRAKWEAKLKPQARSANGLWVGAIGPCGQDHLLFIGASQEWVSLILSKNLHALREIQSNAISEPVILQWEATRADVKLLQGTQAKIQPMDNSPRHEVHLPVTLHQSSSGFAFALIPLAGN